MFIEGLHVNFARDPKYSWFHEHTKIWLYCLYLHLTINIYENIYNLGNKTVFYLIWNRMNGFVGVQNGKKTEQLAWTRTANGAHKRFVLHVWLGCGSQSITTPASLLAIYELDVRSVLHGQVSLAAVNHICIIHEAMNGSIIKRFIKGLLRKCKYIKMSAMIW